MELKKVAYLDDGRVDSPEVVYLVYRNKIYFTGISAGKKSTINAAEDVIKAICKTEGLRRQDYVFYDVICQSSYAGYASGEYRISRLIIQPSGDDFRVILFPDIAISPNFVAPPSFIPEEVDLEVMAAFRPFIGVLASTKQHPLDPALTLNW